MRYCSFATLGLAALSFSGCVRLNPYQADASAVLVLLRGSDDRGATEDHSAIRIEGVGRLMSGAEAVSRLSRAYAHRRPGSTLPRVVVYDCTAIFSRDEVVFLRGLDSLAAKYGFAVVKIAQPWPGGIDAAFLVERSLEE